MNVNYELYKVFYHVAVSLSFSEASKQLFISQSAVSQSVKTLEKKLDQKLFIRSTKKVQLTPEGEILLRHIEPAIRLIQRGESQVADASLNGGQIRIGASTTICRYFLLPYLEQFHREQPDVHIKIMNQHFRKCVNYLDAGRVDFIITSYPNSALGSSFSVREITSFQDVFLAGHSFDNLRGKKLSFAEILSHPILMPNQKSAASEYLHALCQQHQLDLVPEIEISSGDLLIDLARIGLGIAFVPEFCAQELSPDLFPLDTEVALSPRKLVLAYNEQLPLSKPASAFLDYLLPETH